MADSAKQRLSRLEAIGQHQSDTDTFMVRCARCGFPSSLYPVSELQSLGWKQSRGHPDYRYYICYSCVATDKSVTHT